MKCFHVFNFCLQFQLAPVEPGEFCVAAAFTTWEVHKLYLRRKKEAAAAAAGGAAVPRRGTLEGECAAVWGKAMVGNAAKLAGMCCGGAAGAAGPYWLLIVHLYTCALAASSSLPWPLVP